MSEPDGFIPPDPVAMPTDAQMSEIATATQLLAEAMARAAGQDLRPGTWFQVQCSVMVNEQGVITISNPQLRADW